MNLNLVSIVIPFYNEEKYIAKAIQSALNQDYPNIEIVLVDDNSTDQSLEICKRFNDHRIKIIKKDISDRGEASSRNVGIQNASGKLIVFLDGDDEMVPHRISEQVEVFTNTTSNIVVGCWTQLFGLSEGVLNPPVDHKEIIAGFNREYNRATMIAGTLMCDRALLLEYPYRKKFKYFTDYDLLLRLYESQKVKFCNIPRPLYHYYIRKKGTKFQDDWFDYNIFLRDCKYRRRSGLEEFNNPNEMFLYYKQRNFKRYILYKTFVKLLYYKLKLKKF
jgi:glycosyltransferase involved in cell wall biosynthesis